MGPGERISGRGEPTGRPPYTVRIVTLFPSLFECWLHQGVVARAVERGLVAVSLINLRGFGVGRHQVTDDYPFGGGAGMVMKPEPFFAAVESIEDRVQEPVILMSPQGRPFDQRIAEQLAHLPGMVLVAGHYEGVDERVRQHLVTDELSLGDYVLSSGELAAMVVSDAVVRLVPGALAAESTVEESFTSGLLEYPQYTRPAAFRGWSAPPVLLSGHHGEVARWRRLQSLRRTFERRPDLLEGVELSPDEADLLEKWRSGHDGRDQLETPKRQ